MVMPEELDPEVQYNNLLNYKNKNFMQVHLTAS